MFDGDLYNLIITHCSTRGLAVRNSLGVIKCTIVLTQQWTQLLAARVIFVNGIGMTMDYSQDKEVKVNPSNRGRQCCHQFM